MASLAHLTVARKPKDLSAIRPTDWISVRTAAKLAFPDGGVSTRVLTKEIEKGNLRGFRIGDRWMTSLADIRCMVEAARCRNQKAPVYGSNPRAQAAQPRGSYGMGHISEAQAALKTSLAQLKDPLQTTLPESAHPPQGQILLMRSMSRTS
jgi:hypothetical protein